MHAIVHVEIPAKDVRRAKRFYGKVFGWKFVDFDRNYTMFSPRGRGVGGAIYKVQAIPKLSPVHAYVQVADVDKTLRTVRAAGARVFQTKAPVPGYGWYAGFKDPQGAEIWLWQVARRRKG